MIHECHIDTLRLPEINAGCKYTPKKDVALVAFWASQTHGDYLEIGCNTGQTLKAIAQHCPTKICNGVDWSGNQKLWDTQKTEVPFKVGSDLGGKVPNARIYDCDALSLNLHDFNYGCVFMDADHSLEWQKEMFLNLWNHNNYRDWVLIVHDSSDAMHRWCVTHLETTAFLKYIGSIFPVIHWVGSSCATAFISRRGKEPASISDQSAQP